MRLSKEDYREAKGYLKRYNYNCLTIINLKEDIMNIGATNVDGMPKPPYSTTDRVAEAIVKMDENENIKKASREIKIVHQALLLVNQDSNIIFDELYRKNNTKWNILNNGMSERTFERRHKDLIYTVHKEIKKVGGKLAEF